MTGGVGGGGGSLISGSLQYFVISDVLDVCFPDFIALGYLGVFLFKTLQMYSISGVILHFKGS